MIKRAKANRAFSLVELLMVMVLVGLMASALVFSFGNLIRGAHLDEGAGRVEGLVRFARAQAANTGRKVRLVFGDANPAGTNAPSARIHLTWEPNPLTQPGQYLDMSEVGGQADGIEDLVRVEGVQVLDDRNSSPVDCVDPAELAADIGTNRAPSLSSITFYPDGTSDSAEITLASNDSENVERVSVRIAGLTGSISRSSLNDGSLTDQSDTMRQDSPTSDHLAP